MSKNTKQYSGQIPFDLFGNQLHYPEGGNNEYPSKYAKIENNTLSILDYHTQQYKKVFFNNQQTNLQIFDPPIPGRFSDPIIAKADSLIWIDNYIFPDTLKFNGYSRGRSAAYINLISEIDQRKYTCFLINFESIIFEMNRGIISGNFTFCKRGQNFGVKKYE